MRFVAHRVPASGAHFMGGRKIMRTIVNRMRWKYRAESAIVMMAGVVLLLLSASTRGEPPAKPVGADADAARTSIVKDTGSHIVIDCKMGPFTQTPILIQGRTYTSIALGKEELGNVKGAPALPAVVRNVIIPNDGRMAINVTESEYYDIPDILVAPAKGDGPGAGADDAVYTFGEVYETDAFYPDSLAILGKPYILRDFRGVAVKVNPFQYNPVTRTLRVYTGVTVEIIKAGVGQVNVNTRPFRPDDVSLAFHEIYGQHFMNYAAETRHTPKGETGDVLIICPDSYLPWVRPLVDHKRSIDINTRVVGVSKIGSDAAAIKEYIRKEYNRRDLGFVLLVGDTSLVAVPSALAGSADRAYGRLAGDDDYPDVLVGRMTASTPEELQAKILRTVEHETTPTTKQLWFEAGLR
jgi:gingipain R